MVKKILDSGEEELSADEDIEFPVEFDDIEQD